MEANLKNNYSKNYFKLKSIDFKTFPTIFNHLFHALGKSSVLASVTNFRADFNKLTKNVSHLQLHLTLTLWVVQAVWMLGTIISLVLHNTRSFIFSFFWYWWAHQAFEIWLIVVAVFYSWARLWFSVFTTKKRPILLTSRPRGLRSSNLIHVWKWSNEILG